jgi:hypothetical protein
VVVEIDIAPTKRNCSNLQHDSRSQDFKSRSQSLIQKIFLIFIQHHRFYKKIPPPFFQDNYVATSIVQHCCHALGLSNPSIKLSNCYSKISRFLSCLSFDNKNLLHSLKTIVKVPHSYY